jgi:hypothetical protein
MRRAAVAEIVRPLNDEEQKRARPPIKNHSQAGSEIRGMLVAIPPRVSGQLKADT